MPHMDTPSAAASMANNDMSEVMDPVERIRRLCETAASINVDNTVPIKRYWRSGKELLRMANIYREEQALDKSFILYMKYITLFVEKIPQHLEYKSCEPNEKALTKTNCKQIFPVAEQLKKQLTEKYQNEYDLFAEEKKRRKLENEKRNEEMRQQLRKRREADNERQLQELELKFQEKKQIVGSIVANSVLPAVVATDNDLIHPLICNKAAEAVTDIPTVDRSTKPSLMPVFSAAADGLTKLVVPTKLIQRFLQSAEANTIRNIETCAVLAGRLAKNVFTITHAFVPKQKGTSDSCQTLNEEDLIIITDSNLVSLGWIHTHPTQNAFMSSIDLHTHCPYQTLLPEAVAIVCAPKFDEVGVFSLTDPYGVRLISTCTLTGFHPHPTQPPIYEQSSHVMFDNNNDIDVIDLR
ncbi:STAM-binding protein-like A [Oppia nitens]|uniref:STAM-binding protein-like A n=1 Tax=Oppia nitens TaxID=1686743 RepID=UPI0023DB84EE|nr:STAM-binding protein-like A [Oppia nitens]